VFRIPTKARDSFVHQSEKRGSRIHLVFNTTSNGGRFSRVKNWSLRLTIHVYLVKKMRINGTLTTPSRMPSWHAQGQILALQRQKIISHAHTRLQGFIKPNEFNSTRKDTNYKYQRVTYNNRYESTQDFVILKSDIIYIYIYIYACILALVIRYAMRMRRFILYDIK